STAREYRAMTRAAGGEGTLPAAVSSVSRRPSQHQTCILPIGEIATLGHRAIVILTFTTTPQGVTRGIQVGAAEPALTQARKRDPGLSGRANEHLTTSARGNPVATVLHRGACQARAASARRNLRGQLEAARISLRCRTSKVARGVVVFTVTPQHAAFHGSRAAFASFLEVEGVDRASDATEGLIRARHLPHAARL